MFVCRNLRNFCVLMFCKYLLIRNLCNLKKLMLCGCLWVRNYMVLVFCRHLCLEIVKFRMFYRCLQLRMLKTSEILMFHKRLQVTIFKTRKVSDVL